MDENYYLARMRASVAMSRDAAGSAARLIHFDLAGRYGVAAALSADASSMTASRTSRAGPTSFHAGALPASPAACCAATG